MYTGHDQTYDIQHQKMQSFAPKECLVWISPPEMNQPEVHSLDNSPKFTDRGGGVAL